MLRWCGSETNYQYRNAPINTGLNTPIRHSIKQLSEKCRDVTLDKTAARSPDTSAYFARIDIKPNTFTFADSYERTDFNQTLHEGSSKCPTHENNSRNLWHSKRFGLGPIEVGNKGISLMETCETSP